MAKYYEKLAVITSMSIVANLYSENNTRIESTKILFFKKELLIPEQKEKEHDWHWNALQHQTETFRDVIQFKNTRSPKENVLRSPGTVDSYGHMIDGYYLKLLSKAVRMRATHRSYSWLGLFASGFALRFAMFCHAYDIKHTLWPVDLETTAIARRLCNIQ